ncbi:MAG: hypothetical protein ABR968_12125 [Bacteroidales bacterium]
MTEGQPRRQCWVEWTDKADMGKFVNIMWERKCIYTQRELYNFFLKPFSQSIVRCNARKLELIAYLFHRLCAKRIIRRKGGKGYFVCIERRFTDFDRKKFKKDLLKYLSSEVHLKKSFYAPTRKEVEEIIASILK